MPAIASLTVQRAKVGLSKTAATIKHCEWISLGVLALEAADRARAANDAVAENNYLALARKCDACADQVWLVVKGDRS